MIVQRYKNDGPKRKRLFVADAMAHPAKGHIAMWEEMVLRYSKEGDTICDPMSGIGTTLIAALMGRSVICVELEHHFLLPMVRSWAKMRTNPMLGFQQGDVQMLWGDARNLGNAQPWPYGELAVLYPKDSWETLKARRRKYRLPLAARSLPQWSADAVITSPPFQDQLPAKDPKWWNEHRKELGSGGPGPSGVSGYTRPPQVDVVVTSPPFQDQEPFADKKFMLDNGKASNSPYRQTRPVGESRPSATAYSDSTSDNIGNLKNAAYWEAMRQVYAECWRVLRPGGIMALVLKGFTREGKYVDLPGQTEAMLLEAGWLKHDEWLRELWSLSFWRTLQKRRDPAAFDERLKYETVLAFRKPEGTGRGVDTIVTSPPV